MLGFSKHREFAYGQTGVAANARPVTATLGSGVWRTRRTTGTWPSGPFFYNTFDTSVATTHLLTSTTESFTSNYASVDTAGIPGEYFSATTTYSEKKIGSGALNIGRSLIDANRTGTAGDEDYYWTNISTPTTTSINTDFGFASGDFTIEFWLYPGQQNAGSVVEEEFGVLVRAESDYVNANSTNGFAWSVSLRDNPSTGDWLTFSCIDSTTNTAQTFNANITVSDYTSSWVHIAVARGGGNLRMYVGGTLTSTATISSVITPTSWPMDQTRLKIGSKPEDDYRFTGSIDELRISSTARYVNSFTPQTTPFENDTLTIALLHFDGDLSDDTVFHPYLNEGYVESGYVATTA